MKYLKSIGVDGEEIKNLISFKEYRRLAIRRNERLIVNERKENATSWLN